MIDWIRSWFCDHEWQLVQKGVLQETDFLLKYKKVVGHYQSYVCNKCLKGKMVKWE